MFLLIDWCLILLVCLPIYGCVRLLFVVCCCWLICVWCLLIVVWFIVDINLAVYWFYLILSIFECCRVLMCVFGCLIHYMSFDVYLCVFVVEFINVFVLVSWFWCVLLIHFCVLCVFIRFGCSLFDFIDLCLLLFI